MLLRGERGAGDKGGGAGAAGGGGGPGGIDVVLLREVKEVKRARLTEYAAARKSAQYHEKKNGEHGVWTVKCDIALPCATQNDINLDDAKILVENGTTVIGEGANMP